MVKPSATGTVVLTDVTSLPQNPFTMPSDPPASNVPAFDHSRSVLSSLVDTGSGSGSGGLVKLIEKRLKPHDSSPAPELMSVLSTSSNELCPVTSIDSSTSV